MPYVPYMPYATSGQATLQGTHKASVRKRHSLFALYALYALCRQWASHLTRPFYKDL